MYTYTYTYVYICICICIHIYHNIVFTGLWLRLDLNAGQLAIEVRSLCNLRQTTASATIRAYSRCWRVIFLFVLFLKQRYIIIFYNLWTSVFFYTCAYIHMHICISTMPPRLLLLFMSIHLLSVVLYLISRYALTLFTFDFYYYPFTMCFRRK